MRAARVEGTDGDEDMTTDMDDALHALERVPDHAALTGIEDRVLAAIDARHGDAVGSRMTVGLSVGALLIGAGGAALPYRSATASTPASFAAPGPLAPSSLLLGSAER